MAQADAGLELPIGLTEQKFTQQLARIEARALKTAQRAEDAFKRSNASSARSFAELERSSGRSLRGMQQLLKVGGGLLAGGVVAQQVRHFLRLADAATKMQNSLRVAGLEGDELNAVYAKLFQSAQKNSAPISSLVDLYSKLSLTQKELGVSSSELIQFTDGIAVALRVGGTDAQAASGSLLQLSQALGGGVVRAEEFNSILEGTPTIAQAVARGLKEAGGSVAELRKLVTDGQVSSTAFFRAFGVGSEELRRQAETTQTTAGQAFTQLGNSLVTMVGEFDQATGASSHFADMVGEVASGIDGFDADTFIAQLRGIAQAFADAEEAGTSFLNSIGNSGFFAGLNEVLGITEGGILVNVDKAEAEAKIVTLERLAEGLQAQIESDTRFGIDVSGAVGQLQILRGEIAAARAEAANIPKFSNSVHGTPAVSAITTGDFYDGTGYQPPTPAAASTPVSIADHPAAPSKPKKAGGGRKGKTGGKGGGSKGKTTADILGVGADDARDIERAIQLIGLTTQEAAKLEAKWSMLDAAKKAGIPVNDKLNAQIEAQAAEIGQLTAELERQEIAQDRFDTAIDGIADSLAGALLAGESLRDGLAQVFKQIASDILSSGIRAALNSQFGGGGGFNWGSLLGGLFGGGDALTSALRGAGLPARANGGPVTAGQAYMTGERGPEPFIPAVNGRILSVPQAQAALRGGGDRSPSSVHVHVTAAFDESGNLYVKEVAQDAAATMGRAVSASIPGRIQQYSVNPRRR